MRLEIQNYSLIYGTQNGCCVSRRENNINLQLHQSPWVTRYIVTEIFWKIILKEIYIFFCIVDLYSGFKIFSKPWYKQMYCHPGFLIPFIEHRQSRFSIILKALWYLEWYMSIGFNLKSLVALTSNKRVSLPFEALKPGTDFSSLAKKLLDDIFFQQKIVLSMLKTLFCVVTFINDCSWIFWVTCYSFDTALATSPCNFMFWRWFLSLSLWVIPG